MVIEERLIKLNKLKIVKLYYVLRRRWRETDKYKSIQRRKITLSRD